jgi:hypothetical protein
MTEQQMLNKIAYQKKQTAFAWAKYYEAETQQLTQNISVYVKMDERPPETPDFVLVYTKKWMNYRQKHLTLYWNN